MPSCLEMACLDRALPRGALRLYGYLFEAVLDPRCCDFQPVKIDVLSRMTGINRSEVSRHLTLLVNRGYLLRLPGESKPFSYAIPRHYTVLESPTLRSA